MVWRTYHLPKGKLEPFTDLMVRPDVPIFVRAKSGAIEIQATERQQAIFHAFFQLIDPSKDRVGTGWGFDDRFGSAG